MSSNPPPALAPAPTPGPASPLLPHALQEVEVWGAGILGAGATITATVKEFGNTAVNADTAIALAILATLLLVIRTVFANVGNANAVVQAVATAADSVATTVIPATPIAPTAPASSPAVIHLHVTTAPASASAGDQAA
jgi:hypothetical protein